LPVKVLLARVIANKESTEEDGALPRKLTERTDYIPSLLYEYYREGGQDIIPIEELSYPIHS